MDVADALGVLDVHDVADLAAVDHMLERVEKGGVPEDVADEDADPGPVGLLAEDPALLGDRRYRLLEKQIVALADRGERRSEVVAVHR